jgi:hypothetical protein
MVDDGDIPGLTDIIVTDLRAGNILMGNKGPVVRRRIIPTAKRGADTDIGSQGRPTVIIGAVPPAHPGGRPFLTGDPHPSITVLEEPAAIVERRPAPGIFGSPGPAFIRIDPVAVGGIGLEIRTGIGQPDISVIRVVDPLTIRTQLVIKRLVRYIFRLRSRIRRRRSLGRRILVNDIHRTTSIKKQGRDGH